MQLKLGLFDNESVEGDFAFNVQSRTGKGLWDEPIDYEAHIRRNRRSDNTVIQLVIRKIGDHPYKTFIVVAATGTPAPYRICIPEINELSKARLIEFVHALIRSIYCGTNDPEILSP